MINLEKSPEALPPAGIPTYIADPQDKRLLRPTEDSLYPVRPQEDYRYCSWYFVLVERKQNQTNIMQFFLLAGIPKQNILKDTKVQRQQTELKNPFPFQPTTLTSPHIRKYVLDYNFVQNLIAFFYHGSLALSFCFIL